MKINSNIYWALAVVPALAGCADYIDTNDFVVDKPANLEQYEYLNEYQPLKSYIDRASHPGFLLGTGVTASEYIKQSGVFLLTNSNFDMVTSGNAMKYASCVKDDGSMDFSTVYDFVNTANSAGIQVYGHTLCWHAQQNVKWLNSLIADKELDFDPDARVEKQDYLMDYSTASGYYFWAPDEVKANISINSEEGCFELVNPVEDPDNWHIQYHIGDGLSLTKGNDYQLKVMVRGTGEGAINVGVGPWSGRAEGRISFGTEWEEKTVDFKAVDDGGHIMAQSGKFVGTIQIKYVKIVHNEAPTMTIEVPLVSGGDAENGPSDSFIARYNGDNPAQVVDDALGTGKVFVNPIGANPANEWDSQFFIVSNTPLQAGDNVKVSFRYRCDDTRNVSTQAHGKPGSYHHWEFIGTLNATPQWKEHTWSGSISASQAGDEGCSAIAFNLATTADASNFYIDDIKFVIEKSANSMPLTDEEKCEVLTAEMERWVKGIMDATEGKVKAWDVVNEAISGGPWGQRYDLQHGTPDNNTDFFWQDYLGDNFVRVPVKFARHYFEENGGNPDDLKLFINDYNLESDWDDNQKLKSLIQWIDQWESDGETRIDGIGTQMHVSYHMNPTTQKSKEEHIVKMFELMAASGKLCRITELDMGLVDENGNSVKTSDVTFEQEKAMAEYYKFIVEKYFEIIPQSQQFGICQWAQTDSPEGSGWRGGEPIGLWNLDYQRKPAYGGFADGLQGK